MSKLNVLVREESIQIDQGGPELKVPRAFLLEMLQALMRECNTHYYQCQRVTFAPRSVTLSDSRKLGEPFTIAVLQRSSVPKLVLGLLPHLDQSYVGREDQLEIDAYVKKHKQG